VSPYDVIARYYDVEHAGLTADIEMYRQFAVRQTGAVLIAGVGTGRVALGLTAPGREVWGVDNNASMLSRARESAGETDGLTLVHADMRELDLGRTFSLVVVPLDTFLSLASKEQQRGALEALGKHLEEDGLLLIDVVNPLTLPSSAEEGMVRQRYRGEIAESRLSVFDAVQIDHAAQEMVMHLTYDVAGRTGIRRETAELTIRWVYRFEMEHLCSLSALGVTQVYGDYDLSPYESSSPRMIFAVTRTSS
jgi:SAM-dependent methyltransferase